MKKLLIRFFEAISSLKKGKELKYAKPGDAGIDLVATSISHETAFTVTYGTSLHLEIPKGYVGFIFPRSSIRETGLMLSNSVGVVDSGYRGEVMVTFYKVSPYPRLYEVGDRICQLIVMKFPMLDFEQVDSLDELSKTERGAGAYGSTGGIKILDDESEHLDPFHYKNK